MKRIIPLVIVDSFEPIFVAFCRKTISAFDASYLRVLGSFEAAAGTNIS